jgi:sterol desaturase/sphingolipid hydroxylase (fatty acid hydroxylase superfamily)
MRSGVSEGHMNARRSYSSQHQLFCEVLMTISDLLLYASLALLPIFFIAERLFAARWLSVDHRWTALGLVFFAIYMSIGIYLPLLLPEAWFAASLLPGAELGVAAGAVLGFGVLTLVNYAWHRLVHRVPLLWRVFHQMHHGAPRLDVAGAFVFHPSEMVVYTLISVLVTTLVLGLDPLAASIVGMALAFNGVFQHSNLRTPRWLGYLVQRPEAHSIHHARGVHAYNYSDFPLWDLLFGTFRAGQGFAPEAGFDKAASGRWLAMALFRDVHRPDFRLGVAKPVKAG